MEIDHKTATFFALIAVCTTIILISTIGNFCVPSYLAEKPSTFRQIPTLPSNDVVKLLHAQRNQLSKLLDSALMELSQLKCLEGSVTSTTGGWCNTAVGMKHNTDWALIPALKNVFQNKTVASFGEGPGVYKSHLKQFTQIYDAFDGSPFIENITAGEVKHLDLSVPQYGLNSYDWVISLEVAEHIEEEFEDIFLDNLVRHTKVGLILSWAVPGQPGFQHVNGRHFTYVARKLAHLCFKHDWKLTEDIQRAATLPWLKANTHVYMRSDCQLDELML